MDKTIIMTTTVIIVVTTIIMGIMVIMADMMTDLGNLMQRYSSMNANIYDSLAREFGPARWIPKQVFGLPQEGWFLLEITPCPTHDEMERVVSDIVNMEYIHVENGRLYHSEKCTSQDHSVDSILKQAICNIKEKTYLVAVYPGCHGLLDNQPIAIVIDPIINLDVYPDQPHINMGSLVTKDKKSYLYFPDSICYGYNNEEYSDQIEKRLRKTFVQISMWLFRHQVWIETRKIESPGTWIGPKSSSGLSPKYYTKKINPLGECRCGSHKKYAYCHMPYDYAEIYKCSLIDAQRFICNNISYVTNIWEKFVSIPQQHSISLLRSTLL